jgi:membrane dipeptidase
MIKVDPKKLHDDAIVIDGTVPITHGGMQYLDWYKEGGCTAVAPTVGSWFDASFTIRYLAKFLRHVNARDDLVLVKAAADIERAKAEDKLGVIFHFQGADAIEEDLNLITLYKTLGVGIIQLAYNTKNRIGDGAEEITDCGLSRFGRNFVKRCNEERVIIDCSHTGNRTSLEAAEISERPVIYSHANPKGVYNSRRNISDENIKAIAATGGTIGVVGFPGFVSEAPRPSMDQFVAHIDYIAELVGIDHVALGIDYFHGQHPVMSDEAAAREYQQMVAAGHWDPSTYPPPPYYFPEGIETPQTLQNLTAALVDRGYSEEDIRKILGLNLMRVYRDVWGA